MVVGQFRHAAKDYTFRNGETVPAGSMITTPLLPIHQDETIYPNPDQFDGLRFYNLKAKDPRGRYSAVCTSSDFLTFGHGRHSWYVVRSGQTDHSPGRFFSVNIMKLVVCFILLRYDIKIQDKPVLENSYFHFVRIPDFTAKVLFRKLDGGEISGCKI